MQSEHKQKKIKKCRLTPEESTAYHEAGHAVLTVFLGLSFQKVTIVPEGDSLGHQLDRKYSKRFLEALDASLSPYMLDRLEKIIKVLIAGGIAQRIASGRSNHVGSRSDWDKAVILTSRIYEISSPELPVYLRLKRMEAERMVQFRWKEIQTIKDALLCQKTMSSREVRDVLFPEFAKSKLASAPMPQAS